MKRTLLIILSIFLLSEIRSQNSDHVWSAYEISKTSDTSAFNVMTKQEVNIFKKVDNFENNRARLTLTDGTNEIWPRELQMPNFPTICICLAQKDTIHITSGVGFFANLGVSTVINKDNFSATFFQSADGTNIFKLQKSDTSYSDNISVSAVQQQLTLLKKPAFLNNEIIEGSLEAKFKPFYESESGSPLMRSYQARIFFKCELRVVTETGN